MSSSNWQDRRFMFPTGKEVHQGSRRYSASGAKKPEEEAPPSSIPVAEPSEPEQTKTFSFAPYDGDRRFMFPSAKEVHQPARRSSGSSSSKPDVQKSSSNPTAPTATLASSPGGVTAAIAGRRRSSASSQGGILGGLLATRSNDEHQQRRQSWEDMKAEGGFGGIMSSFMNRSTEKK